MNNLRQHGLWVLNQTVLLRGVNDDAAIQVELADAGDVERAERVVGDHLIRMANRDEPTVTWHRRED